MVYVDKLFLLRESKVTGSYFELRLSIFGRTSVTSGGGSSGKVARVGVGWMPWS